MIVAGILDISISLLLVAHVVVSLLLILVVLMQRPKQEGLGAAFGGGMTDQMFGAQTTNVLQKGTAYFGTAFLLLSLVLAILIGRRNYIEAIEAPVVTEPVSAAPAVPAAGEVPPIPEVEDIAPEGGMGPGESTPVEGGGTEGAGSGEDAAPGVEEVPPAAEGSGGEGTPAVEEDSGGEETPAAEEDSGGEETPAAGEEGDPRPE